MTRAADQPRQLNIRAVIILTIAVIAVSVTVYFVHGYQVQRTAVGLLDQADVFKNKGANDLALNSLHQYLGLMPDDTDALAKYGLWLDEAARTPLEKGRAFLVLKQVLRRDEQRTDVQRAVARLAVELTLFAEAKKLLTTLRQQSPTDVTILTLLAQAESGTKEYKLAAALYTEAIGLAKDQAELYVRHAYLLREHLNEPTAADQQIAAMIKQLPRSPKARLAAVRYYKSCANWDEAEKHIHFALNELKIKDAESLRLAGEVAQASAILARAKGKKAVAVAKTDEARRYFDEGLQLYPQDIELILACARLELQEGGRDDLVKKHLHNALHKLPDRIDQLFQLGDLLIDAGMEEQARLIIARLDAHKLVPFADYLAARQSARGQNWSQATLTLEHVRTHPLLGLDVSQQLGLPLKIEILLGDCYGPLNNPDQQIKAYQRALDKNPGFVLVQVRLASALAAADRLGEAVKQYEQTAALVPAHRIDLARVLIDWTRTLPAEQQQWGKVEKLLDDLAKDVEHKGKAALLQVALLAAKGKLEQARELAEKIRDHNPKETGPWLVLIALAQQQEKHQEALTILDAAEKEVGPKLEWVLARAGYWTRTAPAEAGEPLQKLEKELAKFTNAELDRLLLGLGEAYHLIDDVPAAKKLWTQLAQRQPKNLAVRLRLLELGFQSQSTTELERWLADIKALEGGIGPITCYGEASLSILRSKKTDQQKELGKAHAKLDQAGKSRPSWSRVHWLRAVAFDLQNQADKALESYQKALDLGDKRLGVYKRVLELMHDQGMFPEANSLLQELPQAVKSSDSFYRLFVEVTVLGPPQKDTHQQALKVAEQATKTSSDFRDFLWLGQVALMAKDNAKAEQAFRQARDKAAMAYQKNNTLSDKDKVKKEEVAATWVILLLYLADTDKDKAKDERLAAEAKLDKNQLPIVLAPFCEAMGDLKEAEAHYKKALQRTPNDPVLLRNVASFYGRHGPHAKAEPLLRKLLHADTEAPDTTVKWARRALALVLAKSSDYPKFTEALALLEKNRDKGQLALADEQTRAMVLSEHPGHRAAAIKELEQLDAGKGSLPSHLRFRLAQLYFASKQLDQAETHLQLLLRASDKNPAYLALYVRNLLEKSEAIRATTEVNKLIKVAPGVFEAVELHARVLHAAKKSDQARDLLVKYASTSKVPLSLVARALENLGFITDAAKMFEQHAATAKDANAVLPLAKFLGRQGKTEQALAQCEKAWDKGSAAQVGLTCIEIIHLGKASDAQQQLVAGWIKQAIKQHPKEDLLPIFLADLAGFQGKPQEAIALYESVLARDKDNVIALNNLAYLLALENGKLPEAKKTIDAAMQLAGPVGELLDTRAVVWLQSKLPKNAIQDLQEALMQNPTATKCFHLAQAHLADGNLSQAEQALVTGLEKYGLTRSTLPPAEHATFDAMIRQFKLKVD